MTKTIFDEIQVCLLVRGGLRRTILVENGILNLENGRFMKKNTIFDENFKKSNHKNALEAHFCDLISGKTISDIFMGKPGRAPKPGRTPKPGSVLGGASPPQTPPENLEGAPPPQTPPLPLNPRWATAAAAATATTKEVFPRAS